MPRFLPHLRFLASPLASLVLSACLLPVVHAQPTTVTVQAGAAGKAISPDLFGIFFEDLSYAADGGLYAELVQNRSFEYSPADFKDWNSLTSWQLVQRGGGKGVVAVETTSPLNDKNPHYAVLNIGQGGGGVGLQNEGFDGITVKAGDNYTLSLFARHFPARIAHPQTGQDERMDGSQLAGSGAPLTVRLESKAGDLLGEATLPKPTGDWKKSTATIRANATAADARLVVLATGPGQLALDMVSLFPEKTFHTRANGLRAGLAQVVADLKPKFMRFPGGCLVHGDGLDNCKMFAEKARPEGGGGDYGPNSGGFDQLGYGTLTFTREPLNKDK